MWSQTNELAASFYRPAAARAVGLVTLSALLSVIGAGCLSSTRHSSLSDDYARVAVPPRLVIENAEVQTGDLRFSSAQLNRHELSRMVLERNPSLESARQAWRGALARYPETTAYEDPMVTYTIAPLSIVSSDVKFGQGITVSQALPYPGKRKLRGEIALAEAEAKREGYRAVQRRLALMGSVLFYDYYVLERALEFNNQHKQLVEQYRSTIAIQVQAGKAWLEDVAEIDVEAANLSQQRLTLESRRDLVVAQLNALLHRAPAASVPAPPSKLEAPQAKIDELEALRAVALRERPELRAASSRINGARASVSLADRGFYPDFKVLGIYNGMWASLEHQLMVGVAFNLPLQRGRSRAVVDRARATLRGTRALRQEIADRIGYEVQDARRRAIEADKIAETYRVSLLPAARSRIDANRLGVQTSRTRFVDVLREERSLKTLELRYVEAIASAHRYRAELERAIGLIPGLRDDAARRGDRR